MTRGARQAARLLAVLAVLARRRRARALAIAGPGRRPLDRPARRLLGHRRRARPRAARRRQGLPQLGLAPLRPGPRQPAGRPAQGQAPRHPARRLGGARVHGERRGLAEPARAPRRAHGQVRGADGRDHLQPGLQAPHASPSTWRWSRALPKDVPTILYIGINLGEFCSRRSSTAFTLPPPVDAAAARTTSTSTRSTSASSRGRPSAAYVKYWMQLRWPDFRAQSASNLAKLEAVLKACRGTELHPVLLDLPRDMPAIGRAFDAPIDMLPPRLRPAGPQVRRAVGQLRRRGALRRRGTSSTSSTRSSRGASSTSACSRTRRSRSWTGTG